MKIRLPHLHSDPDWQQWGANAYFRCRCGARRVRRVSTRAMSPVKPGWPYLSNRHGQAIDDTGWRLPAEGPTP